MLSFSSRLHCRRLRRTMRFQRNLFFRCWAQQCFGLVGQQTSTFCPSVALLLKQSPNSRFANRSRKKSIASLSSAARALFSGEASVACRWRGGRAERLLPPIRARRLRHTTDAVRSHALRAASSFSTKPNLNPSTPMQSQPYIQSPGATEAPNHNSIGRANARGQT